MSCQRLFFLLPLCLNALLIHSNTISTGLWFRSHEYSSEKRTSLALCPEKQFHFSSGFELSFDIQLRKELHNYGYIFRIIGNDSVAFDLLSNFNGGKRSLVLTYRNNSSIPFESADLSAYRYGEWVPVVFRLDSRKKEITVSFMGKEIKSAYHSSALKSFRIFFGYCDFQRFKSTEVPPMTIKNIRLLDHQKRQIASWELKKHGFNISYDDLHDLPAIACNPVWEVDRHIIWKKEKAFSAPAHTQVAGNHEEGVVYFANQQFILKYDLEKNKMDTIFPAGGNPYKERANQMIYHPFYNELWSYDFDKQTISRYLFDRNLWTNGDKELKNPLYSQHNSFISPADSCLYVFGGYGEYRYKNSLLKKGVSGKWTLVNYKGSITPRFLASAGLKGKDTLLLLGGYGHPSGKQELGPENYYDLYELDLKNFVMSKRWKLNDISRDFVHANAMIIDEQTKQAFSLCIDNNKTKSYMILKSFDLSTGANHEFADTIPCTFDTVNSFCTLYYNKNNNRLYAINLHNDEEKSEIKVYSLACPPFDPKQIYQSEKDTHLVFGNKYWIAGIIASLLTVCFFIFRNRKNSRQKRLVISEIKDVNLDRITVNDKIPSSVNFIGRFQVFDKTKADVTSLFTPTMKQVLVLIILYTIKNDRGLPNTTFNEILWDDKTEESAHNNRRVNIRKLRVIFEQLEGVEITKDAGYWTVKYDQRFYCDYICVMELIKKIRLEQKIELADLHELIRLTSKGKLLPFIQQEWMDSFKSDYSNMIFDTFMAVSEKEELKSDFKLQIQIADSMFILDSTDEYALKLKCHALRQSGKIGLAKTTYDLFCSEYENLLGTPYKKDFKEITS